MNNTLEAFSQQFTTLLNQKQERALIRQKASTQLDGYEKSLLSYMVTSAWRDGKKYPVKRSLQSMANHMGISSKLKYAQNKLNTLLEKNLLISTQPGEYTVNLTPMQETNWISVKQQRLNRTKHKSAQALIRKNRERERVRMLKDLDETIRLEDDNRTSEEVRMAQLPARHVLAGPR